jgi:heme oxygenase
MPINTKQEFLTFLDDFIADYKNNRADWQNDNLEDFLKAMSSWIEDMDGFYKNQNLPIPTNINWQIFSDMLQAAKMYE